MLYRTLLSLLLVNLSGASLASDFAPFAGPAPMAVLVQKNPADPIIGAETPLIAIYENGDVIYSRSFSKKKPAVYFFAKMDYQALALINDQVRSVTELSGLKTFYSLSGASDQSRTYFYLRLGKQEVVTSVYGLTPERINDKAKLEGSEQIPSPFLDLYQYLCTVYFTESRPWRPALVEAMIWPEDEAAVDSLTWPQAWPDLKSNRVIKRQEGYSIFLDGSQEEKLKKFLAGETEKGGVKIDGGKWSVDWRPVFPSEPVWRKAFARLEK